MSEELAIALAGASARRGDRTVWSGVELSVNRGEFVAVLGPNGSGKSTLLDVVLGPASPQRGPGDGCSASPPGAANSRIGYLPQRRSFDSGTRIRGTRRRAPGTRRRPAGAIPLPDALSGSGRAARRRVEEVIDLVGASAYAARPIGALSGGEQQRLLIAQALVRRPQMLLLDEPLDSLDLSNQGAVAGLIQRICESEGVTVLLVAHDVNPILGYLDRVVYFRRRARRRGPAARGDRRPSP